MRVFTRRAAIPGVALVQLTLDGALSTAIPMHHGTVVHHAGESQWRVRGDEYETRPGSVGVKVPGELYAERARHGTSRFDVVHYDDALLEEARVTLGVRARAPRGRAFDGRVDGRVGSIVRLHRAMLDAAETDDALREALTLAVTAFVTLLGASTADDGRAPRWSDAVRRARSMLDERMTDRVTLDELAAHAGLDKFRLCRAFQAQVGVSPYAYLTHRRVGAAQVLLQRGVPQAEVAARVGLYDQSQLHRHFKRIVGVTPGAFVRAAR